MIRDGIYKCYTDSGLLAIYFIKDSKVVMKLGKELYKTNLTFLGDTLVGKYQGPLGSGMIKNFEKVYSELKNW